MSSLLGGGIFFVLVDFFSKKKRLATKAKQIVYSKKFYKNKKCLLIFVDLKYVII